MQKKISDILPRPKSWRSWQKKRPNWHRLHWSCAAFIKIQKSMRNTAAYEISKNAVDMLESASLRVENAITFLEDAEG